MRINCKSVFGAILGFFILAGMNAVPTLALEETENSQQTPNIEATDLNTTTELATSNEPFLIVSGLSVDPRYLCVGTDGAKSANNTDIIIWRCNGNRDQTWTYTSNGELKGIGGNCIGTQGGNSTDGTRLTLWKCNGNPDQTWTYKNGEFKGIGGKCIGTQGGNSSNGTRLILWSCNKNPDQIWYLGYKY